MKRSLVVILCLSLIFILVGCSKDKKANKSAQTTNKNQALEDNSKDINNLTQAVNEQNSVDKKKKQIPINTNSIQSTKTSPNKQVVKDKNNVSEKITKVNSKIKLYKGTYFDDSVYRDTTLKKYCEVVISNVTNTSFDFTAYQVNVLSTGKKSRKAIFLKNTAVFTEDGTKAIFHGKNYTLNFTFPNYHGAYPIATDMKISGCKPLAGKNFVNNGIPGHEFG
ncbi:hypothetical protein [Clostridium brassicae]|uniref:DUF4352 domain-containing protein n=1 Tax=Clostridium brassicae TaxID=2999072 RepID=A0ABT4DEA0_9CLOT|nr:hypothetical protein [Clostridium brassicae]MCY6960640.1 hypothetical protein [Clostridium brassicae]